MVKDNRYDSAENLQEKAFIAFAQFYPYIAIAGILAIVILSIPVGVYNLAKRGFQTVGIPVIIASIILINFRQVNRRIDVDVFSGFGYRDSLVSSVAKREQTFVSAFLLLYAASVWLLTVHQERPWSYFVVITAIYMILVFQILIGEFNSRIILVEIPLLMLNQIYGVILKYPYYYGWTDIFNHIERAKVTYLTGHTVPPGRFEMYAKFPLYHIFVSEATLVFDINMKTALFVVTPIPYVVTAVLLYYIFTVGFRDDRVPALATVLYSATTIVLFYGNYMITRTMAYVGFVFLLFIVSKQSYEDSPSYTILLVLIAFFITTVHQVSMPQILLLLLILYVCKKIVGFPNFLRVRTLLLVIGIFLAYWLLYAWDFVVLLYDIYNQPKYYDEVEILSVGSQSVKTKPLVEITSRARYLVQNYAIVFYSVLGIGAGLYENYSRYARTLLLFALFTIGVFVPSPLRVIEQAMRLFRFDRFMLFLSPFIAIAMSVGIIALLRHLTRCRNNTIRWVGSVFAVALVVLYVFTSVTAPLVASDSDDMPWSESRKYLTETEVEGFDFVLRQVSPGSIIRSDAHTTKFFSRLAFNDHDRLYHPPYRSELIYNLSNVSEYPGYTVFRGEKFYEDGLDLSFTANPLLATEETKRILLPELRAKNKIFSNGDVKIYYTNGSADGDFDSTLNRSSEDSVHSSEEWPLNREGINGWPKGVCIPTPQ